MRKTGWLTLLTALVLLRPAFSQEYSYTHYDITDGLAGSTAYCMTQDKDGFIWVGTETGVSRFDGTHFRNFTLVDGLPDIEVLRMFGDSKGRVWMAPFRKSICFYFGGKIHNPGNDTLLRRVRLRGNIEDFAEDAAGNILIAESTGLHIISANGSVINYDSIGGAPIRQCTAISRSESGHFLVAEGRNIWMFDGNSSREIRTLAMDVVEVFNITISPKWVVWWESKMKTAIGSLTGSGEVLRLPVDINRFLHNTYSIPDDSTICLCEFNGVTVLKPLNGKSRRLLKGIQVSRAFRDRDGSLWFTTLDRGIYRLNSEEFRSIAVLTGDGQPAAVFSLLKTQHSILAGTEHNQLFRISIPDYRMVNIFPFPEDSKNRIFYIDTVGNLILGATTAGPVILAEEAEHFALRNSLFLRSKYACRKSASELIIGSSQECVVYNIQKNAVTDTLWKERVTALCICDGITYIGTFGGLYQIGPDRQVIFAGKDIPFLTKRITAISVSPDHTIWAASADDPGIIGVRNGSVVARITQKEGLTSNICRLLFIRDHILWVGTDKGLNAVRLDRTGFPVTRYTAQDGLGSNMINTIYVDSTTIYAGTSAGISFFDETRVRTGESCGLVLLGISNAGKERIGDTTNLGLSYGKANIRFEYAGISYRSNGNVRYRYRMLGLDSGWHETSQSAVDYPSLPSGSYSFQLQAINRFDIASRIVTVPFFVVTPFWKQVWWYCLLVAVFLGITWIFFGWRIKKIRRQQEQKEKQSRRMAELEHIAVQSQINPHFIFNCLNSIQQFVFDKDMLATNEYISGFARLIRATLNYSSRPFISVGEEVDYLSDYLSLEKMRFKDKMDYRIEVAPGMDIYRSLLPAMLLQPYVENSVRHGLRHKTGGQGYIHILFQREEEGLRVVIRDNGIGRKKAMEYKTKEHIEYQSKGMSLTTSRIQLMRTLYKSEIEVRVEDVIDDRGQPDGTRIEICFPVFQDHSVQG